jgi:hypothetical protein
MAQLIFNDTGMLVDQGRSAVEYENDPDFDPGIFQVVDVVESFLPGTIYFYFPSLNMFFKFTLRKHAISRAFQHVLSPTRIQEIIDDLESNGSIYYHINRLNIEQIRRKINRLYDNAKLTLEERDDLIAVLAHF